VTLSPAGKVAARVTQPAHVVQQRKDVQLKGGIDQPGDGHERHADAVADAVVAGRSAEPLLDQVGGGARRDAAVQRSPATTGTGPGSTKMALPLLPV